MSESDQREYAQVVEALRQAFCDLQHYSFHADGRGGVVRVPDRSGRWVEFQAGHELFDHEMVDAAISKLIAKRVIAAAQG